MRRVGWGHGGRGVLANGRPPLRGSQGAMRSSRGWHCSIAWELPLMSQRGSTSTSATRIESRLPVGSPVNGSAPKLARRVEVYAISTGARRTSGRSTRGTVTRHDDQVNQRWAGLAARRSILLPAAVARCSPRCRKRGEALAYAFVEGPDRADFLKVIGGSCGRGSRRRPLSNVLEPRDRPRDWTGWTDGHPNDRSSRASRPPSSGRIPARRTWRPPGRNPLGHLVQRGRTSPGSKVLWSRHFLVLRHRVPCQPCHQRSARSPTNSACRV